MRVTTAAVAVKGALVKPAATRTDACTVKAVVLLESETDVSEAGAPVKVTVQLVVEPDTTVVGEQVTVDTPSAAANPVPVSVMACGEPAALSVIVTLAERLPTASGLKVTEIVQFAPAATLGPQVWVWAKSPELAPVTKMLVIDKGAVPVLVSVTTCAALVTPTSKLPKLRLLKLSDTTGTWPVPVRLTVCGEPVALSVTATLAVRMPDAVGLNATEKLQCAPAATVGPQPLLVSVKSPGLVPVKAMLAIDRVVPPLFVRVTD